jgi:hypothetical protein
LEALGVRDPSTLEPLELSQVQRYDYDLCIPDHRKSCHGSAGSWHWLWDVHAHY